jgi:hypothetical protein
MVAMVVAVVGAVANFAQNVARKAMAGSFVRVAVPSKISSLERLRLFFSYGCLFVRLLCVSLRS